MNNKRNPKAGSNTGAKPVPRLTDRQERFVYEYLIDQNASAAAQRAGYSAKTRGAQAAELMKMPLVRERIAIELQDLYARLKVTAFDLLQQQARIAFFDPRKLFKQGKAVPLDELDEDMVTVLQVSYRENAKGQMLRQVRHPSRQSALAALERRYAQFMEMQLDWLERPRPEAINMEEEAAENTDELDQGAADNIETAGAATPGNGSTATAQAPQAHVAHVVPVPETMAQMAPVPETWAHITPAPETPAPAYSIQAQHREPSGPKTVTQPVSAPRIPPSRLPQAPFPLAPAGQPIYGAATQLLCRGWPQPATPQAAPAPHARPRVFGRG